MQGLEVGDQVARRWQSAPPQPCFSLQLVSTWDASPPATAGSPIPSGGLERGRRALALLVAGALFMELLDGTIIATAAPRMARSFGVESADISVAITSYLLTVAVLIPLSGWLSDRLGARRVFATAITIFTIASILCAISTNLLELTLLRVLQGIGGAMMVPVGRMIVMRSATKAEMIVAVAYLTWPALFAPVIAPVLGGVLTSYASWRWIFLINVPLGIAGLILALRLVPNLRAPTPDRLDWTGLLTGMIGLGALVYGASLVDGRTISIPTVAISLVAAGVLLTLAVLHLLRTPVPLIDLRALKIATFRITATGGSLFRLSILAVPFLLPLMFQDDFGWSPAKAGSMVMFVFIGNLCIKPTTTPLLRRFGFRTVLTVSIAMGVLATAACGFLTATTPLAVTAIVLVIGGAFRSIGFTCYNTIAFADVEPAGMVHANTLFATVQQLSSGLAVAAGAVALRLGEAVRTPLGHPGSRHFPYTVAFVVVALVLLPAIVETLRLPRSAGATIGGGVGKRGTNIRQAP
jgi:EmrB/QacA subfamily drug resistance transporter